MESIVTQISEILTKEESILKRERSLNIFLEQLVSRLVGQAIEQIDSELVEAMKMKGYEIEKRPERRVNFLFGSVIFRRRGYVRGSETFYPLDELLGLKAKQRPSKLVQNVFAKASTLGVFRKVSETIGLVSPLSISHQQLQQLAKHVGNEIDRNQKNDLQCNPKTGTRKSKILYLEGDAFCIGKQGGGNFYIHRIQVCEGRRQVGKSRTELLHYKEFIDLDREVVFAQMEAYLGMTYDLSETVIVSNSDEGSGYQKADFEEVLPSTCLHEHFVDRYHVNKKIKERMKRTPELVDDFKETLLCYDKGQVFVFLETLEGYCQSGADEEDLRLLQAYIERNWSYLKPFNQRPSLKGFERVIGSCENHHRLFTYRMKKQGRRWSFEGAQGMIKLLSTLRNGEFDTYSDYVPLPEVEVPDYNWQALFRSYQKTDSEVRKGTKRDYSQVFQAHLAPHRLRMGFRV